MTDDRPWVSTDCIMFDDRGRLLLIRRKNEPFKGHYAFPGGFVETGETTKSAALRELKEETGIVAEHPRLIGVYSDPKRDPRHHTISIAYLLSVRDQNPVAGDDASTAEFVENWQTLNLAFDHNQILRDALRVRSKLPSD